MSSLKVKDMFKAFCTHCGSDNLFYTPGAKIICIVDGHGKHKERDRFTMILGEFHCDDCKGYSLIDEDKFKLTDN